MIRLPWKYSAFSWRLAYLSQDKGFDFILGAVTDSHTAEGTSFLILPDYFFSLIAKLWILQNSSQVQWHRWVEAVEKDRLPPWCVHPATQQEVLEEELRPPHRRGQGVWCDRPFFPQLGFPKQTGQVQYKIKMRDWHPPAERGVLLCQRRTNREGQRYRLTATKIVQPSSAGASCGIFGWGLSWITKQEP